MKIKINTDNNITDRKELTEHAKATVASTLGHLAKHITRVIGEHQRNPPVVLFGGWQLDK